MSTIKQNRTKKALEGKQQKQFTKQALLKKALDRMVAIRDRDFGYSNILKRWKEICKSETELSIIPSSTSTISKNNDYKRLIRTAEIQAMEDDSLSVEFDWDKNGTSKRSEHELKLLVDGLMRENILLKEKEMLSEAIIKKYNINLSQEEIGAVTNLSLKTSGEEHWKVKTKEFTEAIVKSGLGDIVRSNNNEGYCLIFDVIGIDSNKFLIQKELEELCSDSEGLEIWIQKLKKN